MQTYRDAHSASCKTHEELPLKLTASLKWRNRKVTTCEKTLAKVLTIACIVVGVELLGVRPCLSQAYPDRPIRIVTGDVAGANDFQARVLAQALSAPLGQPVIVQNRGGNAMIANQEIATALPDGYTLTLASGSLYTGPFFFKVPYDPEKDFAPVSTTTKAPLILVVHPSVPVKSVKELIALAKARPGVMNYAIGGIGAPSHITTELFKAMAGVNLVEIIYKGGEKSLTGLMSGEVHVTFSNPPPVSPLLKAGRVKALAITSAEPSGLFPGLPTVSATGLPGYESTSIYGILAPARTPGAIISRLNREIVRALGQPDMREKFATTGVEPIGSTPEQYATAIRGDVDRLAKLIKTAGIKTR